MNDKNVQKIMLSFFSWAQYKEVSIDLYQILGAGTEALGLFT